MRILLTVPSLERGFGGPAGKARHLRSALADHGHRVLLTTVGDEEPGALALPRIGSFRGTPIPGSLSRLDAAVTGADLVHVLGFRDPPGTAAALLAHRAGVPYVLEPLGMHRRRGRSIPLKTLFDLSLGRLVVGRAARIVANSGWEASELRGDGVTPGRLAVRPDGVDVDGLLPLPERGLLRDRLGIPESAPLVLVLARIAAEKALTTLLRAVAGLAGVWLLVAGPDGGDGTSSRLCQLRRDLLGGERIVFVRGGLWDADKLHALADADVFAQPSLRESFGIGAAEAACCGLPVVVSEACGVKEWLEPEGSRVVSPGKVGSLRSALEEILGDPRYAVRAGKAAPRLREELSWDRIAERQASIYESVLEDDR